MLKNPYNPTGFEVDVLGEGANTPLLAGLEGGQVDMVKFLLKEGADVNVVNSEGAGTLYLAAAAGDLTLLDLLLKKGAPLNKAKGFQGPWKSPLMKAANAQVGILIFVKKSSLTPFSMPNCGTCQPKTTKTPRANV